MNRQSKRMMQRQGEGAPTGALRRASSEQAEADELGAGLDYDGAGLATPGSRASGGSRSTSPGRRGGEARGRGHERTSPARFLREVRNELRQVAWPTRVELINYSTVVLTVLVVMIALIFALNYVFGKAVLFLFQK